MDHEAPASRSHVALLRGINVGGRNKIKMADLRQCFIDHGYLDAQTYIQSGNVVFTANMSQRLLEAKLEDMLSRQFEYQARVLVRGRESFDRTIREAPSSFGTEPDEYQYDVVFLSHKVDAHVAAEDIPRREGVDELYVGDGVFYFRRLSSQVGKSRFSQITRLPLYQEVTIRNWRTTNKIRTLLG